MTAPATNIPSTPAPVTPESYSDVSSAIDGIIGQTVAASMAENPETEEQRAERERDEKGRFVAKPKDGEDVIEGEQQPVVADVPKEDEPIALPEGMAAVKKIDRDLVAQFKVMDTDGELEVPDIMLEFEANGKTRREPIDKVVKLAQMGVYNHEREQRLAETQQTIQQKDQQFQQVEARARQVEQDRERLLSDPDYLISELTRYEQANTPEARLTREREQVQQQRAEMEFQQLNTQGAQFFHSEILPAVETITKALPYVSEDEIVARLILMTERHKVQHPRGAYVPPSAYQSISQAVMHDIVPWAQQLNEARESERSSATAQARKEADTAKASAKEAQVTAQRKTNLIGRTVKPGTRTATGTSTNHAPPKKPISTIEEAEADTISSAVQAALAGG